MTVLWGVSSKCEQGNVDFPDEFAALEGEEELEQQGGAPTQDVARRKGNGGKVGLCCVTYKILWRATGLAPGEIFTVKSFSAGDDSFGPFHSPAVPAGGNAAGGNETLQVCKEDGDCDTEPVGKFVWEKRQGGAGQPTPLGSVGDIKLCKLR